MNKVIKAANQLKAINVIQDEVMKIPLLVHTALPDYPKKETIEAEKIIAKDTRLYGHIAVMSDANKKKKILHPASSTAASKNYVIPQLFDAAPNCGMRLIATDLTDADVEGPEADQLFSELVKSIPTKTYFTRPVPFKTIVRSFIMGSRPIAEHLNVRTENEIEHTYEQGNMFNVVPKNLRINNFRELVKIVPPVIIFFARYRLGILGATDSHFLSLMKIDKLLDEKVAKILGVKQGQYVFYMHTGSGIIGRYIGQLYSPQRHLKLSHAFQLFVAKIGYISRAYRSVKRTIKQSRQSNDILGFKQDSRPFKMCVKALQASGNQGFANRTVLTHNLDLTLEKCFGRQIKLSLIYDTPHVLISNEIHENRNLWVHRNGTTRALGPNSDVLGLKIGEPGLLAAYENTWAYLGTGSDHNFTTFSSANHELGKLKNTPKSALKYPKTIINELFDPVNIYTQKKSWSVTPKKEHASFAAEVAKEIENNKILNLVARMKTIKTLTHYKP